MTKDEALKMAIEHGFKRVIDPPCEYYKATEEQIEAFVEANKIVREQSKKLDAVFDRFKPKQPTQEPITHVIGLDNDGKEVVVKLQSPLYIHPKQWQGLSDDEISEIRLSQERDDIRTSEMLRKVEAKLWEKNG